MCEEDSRPLGDRGPVQPSALGDGGADEGVFFDDEDAPVLLSHDAYAPCRSGVTAPFHADSKRMTPSFRTRTSRSSRNNSASMLPPLAGQVTSCS